MKTFSDILKKIRKESTEERIKGTHFEKIIRNFLLTDPVYKREFKKIYLWNDFPYRKEFGSGADNGIDLVGENNDGEFIAIQCKCYDEQSFLDKSGVDSFISFSGKSFVVDNKKRQFSKRIFVSTTNNWSKTAENEIRNQNPPVQRINLSDLENANVDWEEIEKGYWGDKAKKDKARPRRHQEEAINKTHEYLKTHDRGKLIMACGTGKTLTSLWIVEKEVKKGGICLYLVPSIALLDQTLKSWMANKTREIYPICVCSDEKVGRAKKSEDDSNDLSTVDLAEPATTYATEIKKKIKKAKDSQKDLIVIFSTYQSIESVKSAQGSEVFDLIIADEAHRTTGFACSSDEKSCFTNVNEEHYIKANKRLYMTATPRIYGENAKKKLEEIAGADKSVLFSMDDPKYYGEEIYRIGFGKAVEEGLLSDYKVLVLTINEKDIKKDCKKILDDVQAEFSGEKKLIDISDIGKLVGCINALSKKVIGDDGKLKKFDPVPMKSAVAFCQTISKSKQITSAFNKATTLFTDYEKQNEVGASVMVVSDHVDGSMGAPIRGEKLSELKRTEKNTCKILTNVRCLGEGVDVPSLDAVLFLADKSAEVDVIQSVGRVMRKAEGKKYGYIIIPVVVSSYKDAGKELDNQEQFKTLWRVLNALRAHDDRFDAVVNKIELNQKKPDNIFVVKCTGIGGKDNFDKNRESEKFKEDEMEIRGFNFKEFEEYQNCIYGKIVAKVGSKIYWDDLAKDVSNISEKRILDIKKQIEKSGPHRQVFNEFLANLQKTINPSIDKNQAIEMLSQHIVMKPIFKALFENDTFAKENPVSILMQNMLNELNLTSTREEDATIDILNEQIQRKLGGVDNAEGKQKIIKELYEKFFNIAFKKMSEKLGIVYTPLEVVDFIIHSVEYVLNKEFNKSLNDKGVNVLDPFTGTGTFITRLLQSNIITKANLERKYLNEIYANEIVLLAYYIASINIESVYHDIMGEKNKFTGFDGICLTDTFQLGEDDEKTNCVPTKKMYQGNNSRISKERDAKISVIIGNPPYSKCQKSSNDDAQNERYERLDNRVTQTYVEASGSNLKNSLYDTYIKAFRWSTDRIEENGIVAFVTNSGWLDGNSAEGFRKTIEKEFSKIYVFDLRGNQRTQGEKSRQEGGKIFGSGSRAPISITILIKNKKDKKEKAEIFYHDIGDYLSREQKLEIISNFKSIENISWKRLKPNEHGDWINARNDNFKNYIPINSEKKFDKNAKSFFETYSLGIATNRDAWNYNSSLDIVKNTAKSQINFYNDQRKKLQKGEIKEVNKNTKKINWVEDNIQDARKNIVYKFEDCEYRESLYRPYFKQNTLWYKPLIQRTYQISKIFPTSHHKNLVIDISGVGGSKNFSVLISDYIPCLDTIEKGQCFPLYWYESVEEAKSKNGDDDEFSFAPRERKEKVINGYIQHEAVTDYILNEAQRKYKNNKITKEDIFYYVYGLLHSKDYREAFKSDLKRELPRLPLVEKEKDFMSFSKAGRSLAELHLNYESVPSYPKCKVVGGNTRNFKIQKLKYVDKTKKDILIYNQDISIENIPSKAYEYEVNGRSAIDWLIDRYQITTDKKSDITNDPNDWATEHKKPRYILDLILSIINLSVQSVDIINSLPKLEF